MLVLQASDMLEWDRAAFLWLNLDAQSPAALVSLAVWTSRWLPTVAMFGLLLALVAGPARWRRALLTTGAAMALAWLGASLIKQGVVAPRPFMLGLGTDWMGHSGGNGFPSSHASVATAFAVSALFGPWSLPARCAMVFAGAVVCWSRIAVGVHFPSDVLAAMLLGGLSAVLTQGAAARLLGSTRSRASAQTGQAS